MGGASVGPTRVPRWRWRSVAAAALAWSLVALATPQIARGAVVYHSVDASQQARLRKVDSRVDDLADPAGVNELVDPDKQTKQLDKKAKQATEVLRRSTDGVWKNMGIKYNDNDDWIAFAIALLTNFGVVLACVFAFSCWRQRFRLVYAKNVWDNWGYSEPDQRIEIVDGERYLFEVRDDLPKVTSCGWPLPMRPRGTFFDWVAASLKLKTKHVVGSSGLDQAMLIQFTNMGMLVFALVGLPMCLIVAPLHMSLGGNAAGKDYLSWQGFANVVHGSRLCWLHAVVVWLVVIAVDHQLYKFQGKFVALRSQWLTAMPHVQACSIMVEGVPAKRRTPTALRQYFRDMFGGREVVETVHLVVHTEELSSLIAVRDAAKTKLMEKRALLLRQTGAGPANRSTPRRTSTLLSLLQDESLSELQRALAIAQAQVKAERMRLHNAINHCEQDYQEELDGFTDSESSHPGALMQQSPSQIDTPTSMRQIRKTSTFNMTGALMSGMNLLRREDDTTFLREVRELYADTAFVTFKTAYDANMARRMMPFTPDREEFRVSVPPDPADIVWRDFLSHKIHAKGYMWLGYGLILGIALLFLPTIGFISSKSKTDSLEVYFPWIGVLAGQYPKIANFWNGIAGALGLNIVLGFLPTMLVLIASSCFTLKAYVWAQHQLQRWYFMFLLVFQLFVVAIAYSLEHTVLDTIEDPLSLVQKLAYGMSRTTHFFLSIFVIQWASVAMEVTRYVQLGKYMLWRKICDTAEEAHAASEPEDQDYYGIGARSARYTANFVIGICFVSLCPLISILAFMYFFFVRVFIGYQVVYAETKKPDLGGSFWVSTCLHCQMGLIIYIAVMTYVLAERASTSYPSLIAGACMFYMIESMIAFNKKFHWEELCHEDVMAAHARYSEGKSIFMRRATRNSYIQPELEGD